MTPYWDNLITREQLITYQKQGCELYDCRNEDRSVDMRQSYPTFVERDFKVFCNGSCLGYVTPDTAKEFLKI